jgi:hypothetical protein
MQLPTTSISISLPMKQRKASCGVQTIGSPRTLKLVLISTRQPVRAAKAAEFITTDRILEDLVLEERLDAMVDRAMRGLAQMKFMKQISESSERRLRIVTALQIEGPPKPKRRKNKKQR